MYKILNHQAAPIISESLLYEINNSNITFNLRSLETDLALPTPKTNFLRCSFKNSDAMFWNNLL